LKPLPKTKLGVTPKQHADLKQAVKNDETLHDALVIARATGARPQEMRNGIKLERVQDDVVKVSIIGAKKHKGFKYAKEARFRAPKGKDRELLIKDPDLAEMASRRKQFKVDKMKPLQDKLRRVRQKVPGAESVSFYSYRHQHKTDLEKQGVDRETIAAGMGQLGSKSQDAYGVKTQVSPKRKNFRKRTIL
jgi:integrase